MAGNSSPAAWPAKPLRRLAPFAATESLVQAIRDRVDTGSTTAVGSIRWLFLMFVVLAALFDGTARLADADPGTDLVAVVGIMALVGSVVVRHIWQRSSVVLWCVQLAGIAGVMRSAYSITPMALLYLCVLLNATYATRRQSLPLIGANAVLVGIHWWGTDHDFPVFLGSCALVAVLHLGFRGLTENLRSFDSMRERRTALAEATTAMAGAVAEEDAEEAFVAGMAWLLAESTPTTVTLRWARGEITTTVGTRTHSQTNRPETVIHQPLLEDSSYTAIDLTTTQPLEESLLTDVRALGMSAVLRLTAIADSERFRRLVERSSDRIIVASPDLVVVFRGGAGSDADDGLVQARVGESLGNVVHPDDFLVLLDMLRSLPPGQASTMNLRFRGESGWRFTETVIGNELNEPSVRGYVFNTRDVTDRLRLENELRHAQKLEAVGRLAAGIAHEINTPIQFIGDNLSFLADAFNVFEEARENAAATGDEDIDFYRAEVPNAIEETIAGVERVATIVGAMRAFGHLDQAHPGAVDIVAALHNTVVVARNETKEVADVVVEADELPQITGYASELNQVFLNLLINAAHAIAQRPEGGRGTIRIRATQPTPAEVSIAFTDDGCGIPKTLQDKIFEPFFTTKEVGKGTGQGLPLCRGIVVDRHRGRLEVSSEPGEYTTFTVVLPIEYVAHADR